MSGDSFLSRWSQRKAEVRKAEAKPAPVPAAAEPQAEAAIDISTLPPIETLTAESDFTAFMAKGVPEAMRQAALRKLWVTDPSVRDYKPLVEYNWDFNAPGYGDLLPTDDIKKLVQHILPDEPAADTGAEAEPDVAAEQGQPATDQPATDAAGQQGTASSSSLRLSGPAETAEPDVAPGAPAQALPEAEPALPARRRHGGALPS